MKLSEIQRIAVVGGGTMGNGVAQVCAANGFEVILIEVDQARADRALAAISTSLDRLVKKDPKLNKTEIVERISTNVHLEGAQPAQVVIEAVTEQLPVKLDIFRRLDGICPPNTILASNTSSLPITQLAAATKRPDKVIGMHFMNPVPIVKLTELIRGLATSDETYTVIKELSEKLGKVPVEVNDYPGFIANRILMPMINEAIYAHVEGVGTVEAIDNVMKLGMGHPMGPLTLADLIGLDVCLAILEVMHEQLGDPKYRPCPLLRKMVHAGYLGRKSGRGFYKYD
ncbi:MAG: 3-hydroxybutyryl-CoA dehydrogenase [candidate division Zixibacteria bacterium]|nr:3-hydroxybutyryl-CoA dehydrogenase [candidate division Zixibacteria bacterium]